MRTFSIAEQALNEPESGTTLAFGVDADDTSRKSSSARSHSTIHATRKRDCTAGRLTQTQFA